MTSYRQAASVAEAVSMMADGARPIAGGTDLVVGARHGKTALPQDIVGIHRITELGSIEGGAAGIRLGALVTHAQIVAAAELTSAATGLCDASAIVGSHATRANGSIGGNVMNASPAMDTGAPLLCLDARAELVGPDGSRTVDLSELWTGPGRTSAAPAELLVAIELPPPAARSGSAYVRLQYRRQMEIAVVGAAARIDLDPDGAISAARVAITALTPVIQRVPAAEAALTGVRSDGIDAAVTAAAAAAAAAATPISDVRASAGYRSAMARVMARRAIMTALARARGEQVSVPASEWAAQSSMNGSARA